MQYRSLGGTGLTVSAIGFGCSRIGGVFGDGKGTPAETVRLLQRALDEGITLYDTADIYAQGESEALLGRAFRDRRDRVVLAGKAGYCLPAQRKLIARVKPLVKPVVQALGLRRDRLPSAVSGALSQDFSPEYLTRALEASLRRLQTDRLDLFQLHSPPAEVVERGEFVQTLERLKAQGKLRRWGVACDTAEDAARCLPLPGVAVLQFPFGLLDPEALDTLLPRGELAERGVGLIARGCFGGGLLKPGLSDAELRERTPKQPWIAAEREVAARQERPLLEAALRFSLHPPAISTTLLGMRTEQHLTDNLRLLAAPPLSDAEFRAYASTGAGMLAGCGGE